VSDITAMSQGIATNLANISGIRTYATIPDNPTMPAAVVSLSSIEYDQAFVGGLTNYTFEITVIVSRVTERRAQQRVHDFVQNRFRLCQECGGVGSHTRRCRLRLCSNRNE